LDASKYDPTESELGLRDSTWDWVKAIQGGGNPIQKTTDEYIAAKDAGKEMPKKSMNELTTENSRLGAYIVLWLLFFVLDILCFCVYYVRLFGEKTCGVCCKCCQRN
jgi:hypothetical protein